MIIVSVRRTKEVGCVPTWDSCMEGLARLTAGISIGGVVAAASGQVRTVIMADIKTALVIIFLTDRCRGCSCSCSCRTCCLFDLPPAGGAAVAPRSRITALWIMAVPDTVPEHTTCSRKRFNIAIRGFFTAKSLNVTQGTYLSKLCHLSEKIFSV